MNSLQLAPVLMLACVFAAAPRGAAQSALLDALPADTMAVFAVDDIDALKKSWSASAMGRLWQDAALDAVRAEIQGLTGQADEDALQETGVSPFDLLGMVHGPVCLAVVAFVPGSDDDGEELKASAAWMFDTGEDLDAFSEGFDRFIDWFVESEGIVFKAENYGEVDVGVMVNPAKEGAEVRYGFVGSVLLITIESSALGRDVFGEIVDGLTGEAESSFAMDSPYSDSVAAAPGGSVHLWANFGEFLRRVWEAEGPDTEALDGPDLDEMGLTKLGELAASIEFMPGGSKTTAHLGFEGIGWIQEVLLAGLSAQDPALMRWVPDSASTCYAMDIDLGTMFDAFLGVTMEQDPDEARDLIAAMSELEENVGFHPRDDLLDNMDGQIAVFMSEVPAGEGIPAAGPSQPPMNYALMLGLSDGESMGSMLDAVVRSQGLHAARQLTDFEGFTIYSVPFFPGMSAHYTVLDDLLVLSLSPSMVKDVLRRKANSELPSLLSVEDVKRRNAMLPVQRTMFGCQEAASQMVGGLASLSVMPMIFRELDVELMDEQGPSLFDLLEALAAVDPEVIEKYYRDSYSMNTTTLSEAGILMVSTGP